MPSTIVCPNCRRPQEESGRLTCPDCSAILPSHSSPAPAPSASRPAQSASTALDEFTIPQRPSGAMTLLRNDLRSEDKGRQQTGWLENIIPKKPRDIPEPEAEAKAKAIREPLKPAPAPAPTPAASPSSNHAPEDLVPEARKKPQPVVAPARVPAQVERAEVAPLPVRAISSQAEADLNGKVSILGVAFALVFVVLATLALLQGREGWLGSVVVATVALLGASILGILHRQGAQKAFWQGFALFGLGYLAMAFIPAFPQEAGVELPTSRLLKVTHAKLTGTPEDPRGSFAIMKGLALTPDPQVVLEAATPAEAKPTAPQSASLFTIGDIRQFTVVGHCGFAVVFALLGSLLSRWFFQTRLTA